MPVYDAMLDALGRGQWDGDRDNWPDNIAEDVWYGVTTDHSQCSGRRCPNISQCSFYRARDELQSADIIVTNHDLTLSDLALGGGAILSPPEDSIYVFDEGHHLPDKACHTLPAFCRLHTTIQWLQDSKKLLAQAAPVLAGWKACSGRCRRCPGRWMRLSPACRWRSRRWPRCLMRRSDDSRDDQQLRFEHGLVPAALIPVAAALAGQFQKLAGSLREWKPCWRRRWRTTSPGWTRRISRPGTSTWAACWGGRKSALALWQEYAVSGEGETPPKARWITLLNSGGQFGFDLRCSPVLAADILQECLWSRAAGVIVTSATITALNSFERFILHSGAPREASYKVVASPFDYANATFVCRPWTVTRAMPRRTPMP